MRKLADRLTFANVISCLALFVALGGASYAATRVPANSIGAKQLRRDAVGTAKIQDGAVTGAKVDLSTLGTVPEATHATSADSATRAGSAAQADSAKTAETAGHATSADHALAADSATDAQTLQGETPDAFVHGSGVVRGAQVECEEDDATPVPLFELPGTGALSISCEEGLIVRLRLENTTMNMEGLILSESGKPATAGSVHPGGVISIPLESEGLVTMQIADRTSTPQTASVIASLRIAGETASLIAQGITAGES